MLQLRTTIFLLNSNTFGNIFRHVHTLRTFTYHRRVDNALAEALLLVIKYSPITIYLY